VIAPRLVEARGLRKSFREQRGAHGRRGWLRAVDGVDLHVGAGEIVGLVGESGSGKTTLGLLLLRLREPDEGRILFDGIDLGRLRGRQLRMLRRRMQIVFQDPASALNPRMSVGALVGEPLVVHEIARGPRLRAKVARLLEEVGLPAAAASRRPHEFSGGQRQRIAIARALAVRPDLVVCDEPVSALDVSVQAQIINLLVELQRRHGMAYLFIAHDLSLVQHLCDRVVVMYLGRVVEEAPADVLERDPRHPYTRLLYEAVPKPVPGSGPGGPPAHLSGLPAASAGLTGCRFRDRCPWAIELCKEEDPALVEIEAGHRVACHRAEEMEGATQTSPETPAGAPAEGSAR
jgi:oligopeptide/dipeptide ABC transporter ATP-binding protein